MYIQKDDHDAILKLVWIVKEEIPRLRWIEVTEQNWDYCLHLHTRSGGWNREWLHDENLKLQENPNYLYDEDDEFDSTYADFYFKVPNPPSLNW